jgi:hypothetical protein
MKKLSEPLNQWKRISITINQSIVDPSCDDDRYGMTYEFYLNLNTNKFYGWDYNLDEYTEVVNHPHLAVLTDNH